MRTLLLCVLVVLVASIGLLAQGPSPLLILDTYIFPSDRVLKVVCKNVGDREIKGSSFRVTYLDAVGDSIPALDGYKWDSKIKPGKKATLAWADPLHIPAHRRANATVLKLLFWDGTTWEAK